MKKQTIKLAALALLLAASTSQKTNAQATVNWANNFQFQCVDKDAAFDVQDMVDWSHSTIDTIDSQWIRVGYAKDKADIDPLTTKKIVDPSKDKMNGPEGEFENPHNYGTPFIASYGYSNSGKLKWTKKYDILSNNSGVFVTAITSRGNNKGVYVAGKYEGKFKYDTKTFSSANNKLYIMQLSELGVLNKSIEFGATSFNYNSITSINTDINGNLLVLIKCSNGKLTFSNGTSITTKEQDLVLVKLSSTLTILMAKKIAEVKSNDLMFKNIQSDKAGNIFMAGIYLQTGTTKIDFDPSASIKNLPSYTNYALAIAKYNSQGNFVWAKSIDAQYAYEGFDFAVDVKGNSYIASQTTGMSIDVNPGTAVNKAGLSAAYIVKLDNSGNYVWHKTENSDGGITEITLDNYGNFYTLREKDAENITAEDNRIWLRKYRCSTGTILWDNFIDKIPTQNYTGSTSVQNVKIHACKKTVLVSAEFLGSFDLLGTGTHNLSNVNVQDGWYRPVMIKYNMYGTALSPEEQIEENNNIAFKASNEESTTSVAVYPNPTTEYVTIKGENTENTTATIYNYSGVAVKTISIAERETTVSVSELPAGMYFVEVVSNGNKEIKKLIKQ
ncbi:MAG: T9SS type A sorting domain-containing protein [Bacteroidetes bacterium]|nr:T9SS type A sorting domain-containing protein [Bacteroidota bacterium]